MTVAGSAAQVRVFVIFLGLSVGVLLQEIVGQLAVLWCQFQVAPSWSPFLMVGSCHCWHQLQPIPQPEVQISPPVVAFARHQVEQDKHVPEARRERNIQLP